MRDITILLVGERDGGISNISFAVLRHEQFFFGVIVGFVILAGWRDKQFFWRDGGIQNPPSGAP